MDDSIYETVPFEVNVKEEELAAVKTLLEQNLGTWFTARKIAEKTGLPMKGTQVGVRKAITNLIEEHSCPIVAGPAGFTWTYEPNMLRHYHQSLQERHLGLMRRIRAVERIEAELRGEKLNAYL